MSPAAPPSASRSHRPSPTFKVPSGTIQCSSGRTLILERSLDTTGPAVVIYAVCRAQDCTVSIPPLDLNRVRARRRAPTLRQQIALDFLSLVETLSNAQLSGPLLSHPRIFRESLAVWRVWTMSLVSLISY